ncbi:MAG TPA: antibiotic biosynthesis monooxygenase [Patescibacteria group bacterium]|nr:antibiotic biosynthesis monooxygenase [Patescibacteria group bacterium]
MQQTTLLTYKVKAEHIAEVKQAIVDFISAIEQFEDTIVSYESYQDVYNDASFIHFMVFPDEKGDEEHRNAPHTKKFITFVTARCIEAPVFTKLILVRSKSDY